MKEVNGSIWHTMGTQRVTPTDFVCVIEISKGSKNKYELAKLLSSELGNYLIMP